MSSNWAGQPGVSPDAGLSVAALARRQPEFVVGAMLGGMSVGIVAIVLVAFALAAQDGGEPAPLADGEIRPIVMVLAVSLMVLAIDLAIAGFLLRGAWRRAALRHRLLREGTEVAGRVTRIAVTSMRINGRRQARVHYAYRDDAGREYAGTSERMPADVAAGWAPGDVGPVRHDPEHPSMSIWVGRSDVAPA